MDKDTARSMCYLERSFEISYNHVNVCVIIAYTAKWHGKNEKLKNVITYVMALNTLIYDIMMTIVQQLKDLNVSKNYDLRKSCEISSKNKLDS